MMTSPRRVAAMPLLLMLLLCLTLSQAAPLIIYSASMLHHGEATPSASLHVPSDRVEQYEHLGGWDALTPTGTAQVEQAARELMSVVLKFSQFPAGIQTETELVLLTADRDATVTAAAQATALAAATAVFGAHVNATPGLDRALLLKHMQMEDTFLLASHEVCDHIRLLLQVRVGSLRPVGLAFSKVRQRGPRQRVRRPHELVSRCFAHRHRINFGVVPNGARHILVANI